MPKAKGQGTNSNYSSNKVNVKQKFSQQMGTPFRGNGLFLVMTLMCVVGRPKASVLIIKMGHVPCLDFMLESLRLVF